MALQIQPGFRQNHIEILSKVPRPAHLRQSGCYYLYRCDCGAERVAHRTTIVRGLQSCGHLQKEKKFATKSDLHYRYLYNVWRAMHYRCYKPKNKNYHTYGGRGIRVCKRWHDFGNFYNDMIDTYERGLTIERKDLDKDYSPDNCLWITNQEQAINRTSSLAYRQRTGYKWAYGKAT